MILVYLGNETHVFAKGTTAAEIRWALNADSIYPVVRSEWYVDSRNPVRAMIVKCGVYRAYKGARVEDRSILAFMSSLRV